MEKAKTWFTDTGGMILWSTSKNLSILLVTMALLLSTSSAQKPNVEVSETPNTDTTDADTDPHSLATASSNGVNMNPSESSTESNRNNISPGALHIPVPSDIRIVNSSESLMELEWDNITEAEGYVIDVTCQSEWTMPCCESCHETHNTTTPNITLMNLASETNYTVKVAAVMGSDQGKFSEPIEFVTNDISDSRPVVPAIKTEETNTSIILRWKHVCFSAERVKYFIRMQFDDQREAELLGDESCMYEVEYRDLDPFKEYNYSVLAVKEGCEVTKPCGGILYPPSPLSTNSPEVAPLSTNTPETTLEDYDYDETTPRPPNEMNYRCSECHQGKVKTSAGIANKVEKFKIQQPKFFYRQGNRMEVTWNKPQPVTGVVKLYQFTAKGPGVNLNCAICMNRKRGGYGDLYDYDEDKECKSGFDCYRCQRYDETTVKCNFEAKINSVYNLQVKALNNNTDTFGPLLIENTTTTNNVWPYIVGATFHRLTLSEKEKYYMHRQYPIRCSQNDFEGFKEITLYQILISEEQQNTKSQTYTTPDEDKKYYTFQGTVVYSGTHLPERFVFGDNDIFPLYAETKYYFIFRVYIDKNFRDSNEFSFMTERNTTKDILVGLLIVFIILILLSIAGYFIYKRYFSPIIKRGESVEHPLLLPKTVEDFAVKPIKLTVLFEEIDKRLSNGKDDLKKEFDELRISSPYKMCDVAKDGFNVSKNRYVNILPFDETRVILDEYRDFPGSDYINASYIHGYDKAKEFIATQGPRDSDLDCFWRMIWEKNIHTIVMVTNCVEARTQKCSKYWPDYSDPYKTIHLPLVGMKIVTVEEASHSRDGYFMRVMKVSKDSMFSKFRLVTHFHFNNWPDMGCPRDPDNLITLAKAVKGSIPKQSSHTIVHCSAGVGRTGTFIALCNLMEEMKVKDSVDVFQSVYRMRQNRMNMVQTLAQYEFLYKCVRRLYEKRREETFRPDTKISLPDAPDVVTTTFSNLNVNDQEDPYENYDNIELPVTNTADQEDYPSESSDECERESALGSDTDKEEDGKTPTKEEKNETKTEGKDGRNSKIFTEEKDEKETILIDIPLE